MRLTIFIAVFLFTNTMCSQKISSKSLINNSIKWYGQPYDPSAATTEFTYRADLPTHGITSFVFKDNNIFYWYDHPKCGLNENATSGEGKWKLANNILTLDFKNIVTEMHGKRGIEKFQIVSITKEELVIKFLK